MSEIDGATLIARSLKQQGINHLFGVVGFPVGPIAAAAQKEGVAYIGMRNEQAASYAARAYGYLTGRPGACIVVTGPGVVHGLAGLADAQQNCWPMILIGGASETYRRGMGAFQEERQVLLAAPLCKFAHAIDSVKRIPFYVAEATRNATYGRPGAAYLDMPDDIITGKCDEKDAVQVQKCPDPPRFQAPPENVEAALNMLERAERPLVLVGKGMAWADAESEVRSFIEKTQVPFLRSPMGKGVMPDDHPLSVAAARTLALQNANVVFLMGARFNWIFHFGQPPRYAPERQGHPARHRAGGDRTQQGDRRGAGRRRQGDHGADERGTRGPPVVPSEGISMAADDQQKVGRECGADQAAGQRRQRPGDLLPRLQGHRRLDAEELDPVG